MKVSLIGDHRQATYQTNSSAKNKKFVGVNIINKFVDWGEKKKCVIELLQDCYRSNQFICDFADSLYPSFEKTNSKNFTSTSHDGIFIVTSKNVNQYIRKYNPRILRYNIRSKHPNCNNNPINWGDSKGLTFDRVLIIPNGPLKMTLKSGDIKHVQKSCAKLYVAITRARYSVAFLFDDKCGINKILNWEEN